MVHGAISGSQGGVDSASVSDSANGISSGLSKPPTLIVLEVVSTRQQVVQYLRLMKA